MLLTSPDGGFGTLLKNRPFLALWMAQILSQVADKIFFVFLIALLVNYQPPPGLENSARSALMFAITLPAILFGSAAGIFVDRFDKHDKFWWAVISCAGCSFSPCRCCPENLRFCS